MLAQLHRAIFNLSFARHMDNSRDKLIKLFSCERATIELSRHLKILPDYFSRKMVDQFCASQTYMNYCTNTLQHQQPSQAISFDKYFTSQKLLRLVNSQQILCLEAFLHWLTNQSPSFDKHQNNYTIELLNLNNPEKWFQNISNHSKRKFIYHHGPTNSGKSTAAVQELKKLGKDQKGIYMAPLRLLAWEYQQKLGNCSLITGQQKQYRNTNLVSCTIEAAPLLQQYEVAVIDEIQMIADEDRGWAWTRAVLCINAKRIHLCGDERALNIISKIVELTGDTLEEKKYSRLSKLTLIHKKFKLQQISEGDCIINFSMNSLINHRNDINRYLSSTDQAAQPSKQATQSKAAEQVKPKEPVALKNHAAIIYGKLPPQCRKAQAASFNSGKLPYLVATNAIGMGLNLKIKKIVFLSVQRPTHAGSQPLEDHQIQQIAGRAGRGKQTGFVQCANSLVLKRVEKALQKVNQTYGIQLQNLKEESNEMDQADEDKQEQKSPQAYNHFLKRLMSQKQCRIKSACFFFQNDYIITSKMHLQRLIGKKYSILQILQYLKTYCKIGELYFFQKRRSEEYLLSLVQNKIDDLQELFFFYNGLTLSLPNFSISKSIMQRIQHSHHKYVQDFVHHRKVALPLFIVDLYSQDFVAYRYMDQINQLQLYFNLIETYVWLWGKFQFAFYQIRLAKLIKNVLSSKINQILQNNQFVAKINHTNSFKIYERNRVPKIKPKAPVSPTYKKEIGPTQAAEPIGHNSLDNSILTQNKPQNEKALFKKKGKKEREIAVKEREDNRDLIYITQD